MYQHLGWWCVGILALTQTETVALALPVPRPAARKGEMVTLGPMAFPGSTTTTRRDSTGTCSSWKESIVHDLQILVDLHHMDERHTRSQSRNKLQPRHVEEFASDSLFDQFARVVCQVSVIPRKEVFETWAMALFVHRTFPTSKRIVDLACSHGLLSWALLLLAYHDKDTLRSAVCVDLQMPKSAEKIAAVMLDQWPCFEDRWDYVEGPLEALQPDSSTLLVGIHACGLLSDKIISHAIQGNSPLALVPCCHSKKSLTKVQQLELRNNPTKEGIDNGGSMNYSLADFIDQYRIHRLEKEGFNVEEATIPAVFTPKNRILLAIPTTKPIDPTTQPLPLTFKGNPEWATPKFRIPVADTPSARATIRSMAGRAAAAERKLDPPRSLNLSLLLPPDNIQLSAQELQTVVVAGAQVEAVCPEPFWHPIEERYVRTFKVTYPQGDTKNRCKELHQILRQTIPLHFPGAQIRY